MRDITSQSTPQADAYETRLRRVLQYIYDHPAGDLSLDALADVAAMSRFHWHRVFHAMTGETCAQAVRRLRAHRAAVWLVQSDLPWGEIAQRCGYDNPQSFARVFRSLYTLSPTAFRAAGQPGPTVVPTQPQGENMSYPSEIRKCSELRLVGLPHVGAYHQIGVAFQQVAAVFSARGLWRHAQGLVGVYYDSPADVPEPDLRSHAGVVVPAELALPDGLEEVLLPGGRHAVLTLRGPYTGLQAAWTHLYGVVLPAEAGEVPANTPPYELYLNDPSDTAPQDLVTEIRVALS